MPGIPPLYDDAIRVTVVRFAGCLTSAAATEAVVVANAAKHAIISRHRHSHHQCSVTSWWV